jgi:hypothetical protein
MQEALQGVQMFSYKGVMGLVVAALSLMMAAAVSAQDNQQVSLSVKDGAAVEDGLFWSQNQGGDGDASFVNMAGREAFQTGPDQDPFPDWYLYGNVDDSFLIGDGSTPTQVWLQVDYLDQGTDKFTLEYDSTDVNGGPASGAYTPIGSPPLPVTKTNSGQWKSKIYVLPNANFANRQNGGSDFRINDLGDGDEVISRVIVSKTELKLSNAGTVSGVVRDTAGKPVEGAQVSAGGEVATTDAQGKYTLTLEAGSYPLQVSLAGYKETSQPITVRANETTTGDFQIAPETRTQVSLSVQKGAPMEDGLFWTQRTGGDGDASFVTESGREAFLTGPDTDPYADNYLYANVLDSFISNGKPTQEVWLTIDYLDRGTDAFVLQYDAGPFPGSYKDAEPVTKTDTGAWLSYTYHLTDASFSNRQNGGSDFRIYDREDGDEVISRITISTFDPATPPATKLGDLNGDGGVNVQDATLSLRIAVGAITPTDAQKAAGDVNHDGKWNVQDTTLILRRAVGAIDKFPGE